MPIFDFLSGQFIDVIEWTDDTRDTLVYRFEREGQTGKVMGERPYSAIKIAIALILAALLALGLAYVYDGYIR